MKKILLLFLFIITGCTNYTDLKNLSIIKSIGIDYDNSYTIYAQIYDEIKKDEIPKTKVISAKANTLENAFKNLEREANKKIYFSHIDLLVLNTNLTYQYKDIISYFLNNNDFRNDYLCIISDNINDLLNNSNYDEIENTIKNNKQVLNITFNNLINNYYNHNEFRISKINYNKKIVFAGNHLIKRKD